MCPSPDTPANGTHEEMVPIETNAPALPEPSLNERNGHVDPPKVKSHKESYGRASDFLSNTSNWKVCLYAPC